MADRTVRAIFTAQVSGAQKGMRDLSGDVDKAGRKVDTLAKDLKGLDAQKVNPKIDLAIEAAERDIKDITAKLGDLRTMEVTPEVTADIRQAERQLADARKALRQLNAAKAEMQVTADTKPAKKAIDGLADDVGEAGAEGGEDAGENIVSGILSALRTIPIAGAVIGVGAAIAGGILLGIKQGLAIEAERDLFGAQTGLDEDTANRFGRAAGEAYANAWGESVAANLDTAKRALQANIIDETATDAQIENVIAKLTGIQTLFDYDIAMAVQGVGNAMKTGLVRDADEAFDLIVAASQKLPSDDLLETMNEYSGLLAQAGLAGEQAFGLIVQAAQAGARDTDKVADAIKEFGLSIGEGLDPALDALKDLGLDADAIVRSFREGGPGAVDALDQVLDALRVLDEKGLATTEIIATLFKSAGEDLGPALFAMDVTTAAEALGGLDGAAGSADRALQTMSDNTSTRMEEARRNVEIAMDGIKGALAEAFGDEIGGAAEWVTKNRAPLMQFFIDMFNGAIRMAQGFVEFGAVTLETFASVARGLADLVNALPFGIGNDFVAELENVAGGAEDAADAIRRDIPDALDEVSEKFNDWAAPEIMKARVHDATVAMTQDMEAFVAEVGETDLDVTINGETMNAEEALAELIDNINAEDGTVKINGDRVPAEDALDTLLALIESSEEDVTVGAEPTPANRAVNGLIADIGQKSATVSVRANTSAAQKTLDAFMFRNRTIYIDAVARGGMRVPGAFDGGWIGTTPGRYAGGWVPGARAGYDNILWPLRSGGMTLGQPLEGKEFVVNSKDSAFWGPLLELINSGWRPTPGATSQTYDQGIHIENLYASAADAASLRREQQRYRSTRSLG